MLIFYFIFKDPHLDRFPLAKMIILSLLTLYDNPVDRMQHMGLKVLVQPHISTEVPYLIVLKNPISTRTDIIPMLGYLGLDDNNFSPPPKRIIGRVLLTNTR